MDTRAFDSWMSAKGKMMRGKRMRPNSAIEVKMEAGVKPAGLTAGWGGSRGGRVGMRSSQGQAAFRLGRQGPCAAPCARPTSSPEP